MPSLTEWIYNSNTGGVDELPIPAAEILLRSGAGWHGPFTTKQEALDYYTANKTANSGWKAPTGLAGNIGNAVSSGATKVGITDPLGNLNLGGWIVRIGEIILGIVLIGVGLAKLTGVDNAISGLVKTTVKTGAKAAIL